MISRNRRIIVANKRRFDGGFTLIELVAVLVLMAILATTAALSLSPYVKQRRVYRGIEIVCSADALARRWARQTAANATIAFTSIGSTGTTFIEIRCGDRRRRWPLPKRILIEADRGQIPIVVDQFGVTPNYAIAVRQDDWRRWVVMIGGSGQSAIIGSRAELNRWMP